LHDQLVSAQGATELGYVFIAAGSLQRAKVSLSGFVKPAIEAARRKVN
jgi:hypothetical protein